MKGEVPQLGLHSRNDQFLDMKVAWKINFFVNFFSADIVT